MWLLLRVSQSIRKLSGHEVFSNEQVSVRGFPRTQRWISCASQEREILEIQQSHSLSPNCRKCILFPFWFHQPHGIVPLATPRGSLLLLHPNNNENFFAHFYLIMNSENKILFKSNHQKLLKIYNHSPPNSLIKFYWTVVNFRWSA